MARLSVIVLCCVQLSLVPAGHAQSATTGHETPDRRDVRLQHIAEPPELAGEPGPKPTPPTPAYLKFGESKAISAANPHDIKTLPPAIQEITGLIHLEPTNSDFYLLRATFSCYVRANSTEILDDLNRSISLHGQLHGQSTSTAFPTLREHYALRAKIALASRGKRQAVPAGN